MRAKISVALCVFLILIACISTKEYVQSQALKNQEALFVRSSNDFGAQLIKKLGGNDNLFISPLSIFLALDMTYDGALEQTREQMTKALQILTNGLSSNKKLGETAKNILSHYNKGSNNYSLELANGLFLQEKYPVKQMYKREVQNYYNAEVRNVDFSGNGEAVRKQINKWVATATKQLIPTLFESALDPLTRLIIINAIYFKGLWNTKFDAAQTKKDVFHGPNGDIKVDMMHLNGAYFRFYDDHTSKCKFLEMPYEGENIIMLFALPENIATTEIVMNTAMYSLIDSELQKIKLRTVIIPKFTLEYEESLNKVLGELGITDLFNADRANLKGISDKNDLYVSDVRHKAIIKVDEKGTEAAAVTTVGIRTATAISISEEEFIADHPFLFYIVDKTNKLILFSGRLSNPKN